MLGVAKHTHAKIDGLAGVRLLKVLEAPEAAASRLPDSAILLWDRAQHEGACGSIVLSSPRDERVINPGDVVRVREGSSLVHVLYRRDSRANVLFTTERCNNLCLMCSQPPRDEDDGWRVEELLRLVPLIDRDEPQLGITGGEPTLLGEGLSEVLRTCGAFLPETQIQVLTNGRRFADPTLAHSLVDAGADRTMWAVPLYADGPARHDEIMGSAGSFAETMLGLAELARHDARVEIRIVLHALSIPRLPELAEFIYRRLPFVEHVAFMGLEPMGYAKGNRDRLWIDPADYLGQLRHGVRYLADRGMNVSIYNLPLCVLPQELWSFARQSISDWKNSYPETCEPCALKNRCAGFFTSAGPAWRSRLVAPIDAQEIAA